MIFDYANATKLFNVIVTGSARPGASSLDRNLDNVQFGLGPFRYSMLGLSEYMSNPQLLPMVVVCGAELADFALYFALSRLRPQACWLLPEWVDEFRKARDEREDGSRPVSAMYPADGRADFNLRHFAQALLSATEFHATQIQFVSASFEELQIRSIVDCLDAAAHWGDGRIKALAKLPGGIDDLLEQVQIAFNTDNYAVPVNQQ